MYRVSGIGQRCEARWLGRLAALLLLAACSTPEPPPQQVKLVPVQPEPPLSTLQAYAVAPGLNLQCVPYARARSGIGIFGDAYTWWNTAQGRYARGSRPKVGSVLVLRKTDRLQYGHVAYVTNVLGPREIRIDHANWQPNAVITGMEVIDVSPNNTWTDLRFWNKDARMWGAIYPANGFIYNVADGSSPPSDVGTVIISGNGQSYWAPQQTAP